MDAFSIGLTIASDNARRKHEWCRAAAVQRRIRSALTENVQDGGGDFGCQGDRVRFHGDPLWSKKRIVWWCRHHAYTPWDQDLLRHVKRKMITDNESNRLIHQGEISTLSDAEPLVERLTEQLTRQREESSKQESDDDDIDIIGCDMVHRVRVKKEVQTAPDTSLPPEVLPPSHTAHFVHEVAAQIGVHIRPLEVDRDTAPGVHAHVVEDMIMAVTRTLMGDVVRKAKALLSEKLKPCEELTAHHISAALNSIPICDIITNSGLGVLSENGTAEEIKPTTHPPA